MLDGWVGCFPAQSIHLQTRLTPPPYFSPYSRHLSFTLSLSHSFFLTYPTERVSWVDNLREYPTTVWKPSPPSVCPGSASWGLPPGLPCYSLVLPVRRRRSCGWLCCTCWWGEDHRYHDCQAVPERCGQIIRSVKHNSTMLNRVDRHKHILS